MNAIFHILKKEIIDAMRDRRTLMMVLVSSLLILPVLLLAISEITSQIESQQEKRLVLAVNMQQAPGLENFILRQGYQIEDAPKDYEQKSRNKILTKPVLVVSKDFDKKFEQGDNVQLEIVYDTSNRQAEIGARLLQRLLNNYSQEVINLRLQMRGVSAGALQTIEIKERYLNPPEERKVALTSFLPVLLISAIVIGGMFAAIDTTAGERERGSLEPLMMNPVTGWQMVLGKWGAVAFISMTVVLLTVGSFFPSQLLIRSDSLRAEFQFGIGEALRFLIVLLPLAACLSSIQVAIALSCKNFKEAQVRNQMFSLLVTMAPFMVSLNQGPEPKWFSWSPVLAQNLLMNHILKGEVIGIVPILSSIGVSVALTLLSLTYVARKMRSVVVA